VLSGVIATASLMAIAQDLHVTSENGTVTMTVAAQKSYALMPTGQQKTAVLTVSCQHKGKKVGHVVTFSPGGILTEQQYSGFGNSASLQLAVNLGGQKLSTNWVAYGNVETFAYYGKTEEDRITFVHAMLNAPSITIEFTPFLTGVPTSSIFDMTELRAEFDRHPECATK
jgi:hypothetical protein